MILVKHILCNLKICGLRLNITLLLRAQFNCLEVYPVPLLTLIPLRNKNPPKPLHPAKVNNLAVEAVAVAVVAVRLFLALVVAVHPVLLPHFLALQGLETLMERTDLVVMVEMSHLIPNHKEAHGVFGMEGMNNAR
jgi:hypothetical protein